MKLRPTFRHVFAAAALAATLLGAGCAGQQKALEQGAGIGVASPGSAQDFQVNVGDRVFYTVDSSTLTPPSRATLDKQAQWLGQYGQYAFTVEGHADERGTREYNLALGARRANEIPDSYFDKMYNSKYAQHFYGSKELEAFKAKWRKGKRQKAVLNCNAESGL